jgi:hypothetical protein
MANEQPPKASMLEREARRLERLCILRLVQPPPPQKPAPTSLDHEPKDAA